jgi:hypothetical protein
MPRLAHEFVLARLELLRRTPEIDLGTPGLRGLLALFFLDVVADVFAGHRHPGVVGIVACTVSIRQICSDVFTSL